MIQAAVIGYGKMGRRIHQLAPSMGFDVKVIIDQEDDWARYGEELKRCDVALEFTIPGAAFSNIRRLLLAGIPVVSGTTGWESHREEAMNLANEKGIGLMISSNFSIGMNLFFELNKYLASQMDNYPGYKAVIEEVHHIHKLDAPSGTAKVLAGDMIGRLSSYTAWAPAKEKTEEGILPVKSIREGEVTGIHTISYTGANDRITISHEAINRDGLVTGALRAASWIIGKRGFQTMRQMLLGDEQA